jgi:hypothetical protein
MIEGGKWDGIDRLPDLYCILGITPNDTLSHTLIYKLAENTRDFNREMNRRNLC